PACHVPALQVPACPVVPDEGRRDDDATRILVVGEHVSHRCCVLPDGIREGEDDFVLTKLVQRRGAVERVEQVDRSYTWLCQQRIAEHRRLTAGVGIGDQDLRALTARWWWRRRRRWPTTGRDRERPAGDRARVLGEVVHHVQRPGAVRRAAVEGGQVDVPARRRRRGREGVA